MMEADALQSDPLHPGDQATKFDTMKSGAMWTEEAVESDEHPADVPSPPSNSLWEWRWELLALAFSIGCMISIVAILFTFQDRPQSEWRGGWLSITATIAIFSTGANSAAALAVGACLSQYKWLHFQKSPHKLTDLDLLEEASRGPLGSLALLARRPWGLASIGAVVTLLAVGVSNSLLCLWIVCFPLRLFEDLPCSRDCAFPFEISGMGNPQLTLRLVRCLRSADGHLRVA